ncbi:MAG: M20 family metallopeptidase [Clostridia bacterium]|nr:M20 family metallopeptidase [Clostridia bacterium]
MKKNIAELRHELHRCAELSGCEEQTKIRIREFLEKNTDFEVCDRGRWLHAFYDCGRAGGQTGDCGQAGAGGQPGADARNAGARNIAFRADMDALPMADREDLPYRSVSEGVSHRCGHDGHSAALCELARLVSERGADCNVHLIFQHAEETGAGGAECAQLMDEKNIDEIYAIHNWSGFDEGSVVLGEGTVMCASEGLRIVMTGRPSHASQPEDGINPAATLARVVAKAGQLETDDSYRGSAMATIVGINAGGRNFGMAPGEGEVDLTLRALREEDMYRIEKDIVAFAEEAAGEAGLECCVEKQDVFPETANDAGAVAKVRAAAESLGLAVQNLERPIRSSEDFGWYQKKCPGALVFIGNGRDWPQIHTKEYDFNDRILETTAELMHALLK